MAVSVMLAISGMSPGSGADSIAARTAARPRCRIGGMSPNDATRAAASGSERGRHRRLSAGGSLCGKHIRAFGHGRADGRLGEQVEAALGGLLEHRLGGRQRIHRRGLDGEHGRALLLGGGGIAGVGVDTARRLEDVGYHRAGQHGLHVNVVSCRADSNVQLQAFGQRQHRVLAHDVGRLQAGSPPPRRPTTGSTPRPARRLAIILGRKARTP